MKGFEVRALRRAAHGHCYLKLKIQQILRYLSSLRRAFIRGALLCGASVAVGQLLKRSRCSIDIFEDAYYNFRRIFTFILIILSHQRHNHYSKNIILITLVRIT